MHFFSVNKLCNSRQNNQQPSIPSLPSSAIASNPGGKPIARVTPGKMREQGRADLFNFIVSFPVTSVVDASYRKSPAKPPVLSPKPAPSEIVKRLSFKRDGLDSPRGETGPAPQGEDKAKLVKAGREEGSQTAAAASSNGTGEVAGNESRVSSMIARLSNGVRPEELNTNPGRQADRKQFLSKFINNNDKPNITEAKEEIAQNKTEPDRLGGDIGAGTVEKAAVVDKQVEDVGQPKEEVQHSKVTSNGLDSHSSPVGAAKLYNESSSPNQLR